MRSEYFNTIFLFFHRIQRKHIYRESQWQVGSTPACRSRIPPGSITNGGASVRLRRFVLGSYDPDKKSWVVSHFSFTPLSGGRGKSLEFSKL